MGPLEIRTIWNAVLTGTGHFHTITDHINFTLCQENEIRIHICEGSTVGRTCIMHFSSIACTPVHVFSTLRPADFIFHTDCIFKHVTSEDSSAIQ